MIKKARKKSKNKINFGLVTPRLSKINNTNQEGHEKSSAKTKTGNENE